ncbi:MAG: hypothetical protein AAFX50_14340 [Acidobacteriota bacterium]
MKRIPCRRPRARRSAAFAATGATGAALVMVLLTGASPAAAQHAGASVVGPEACEIFVSPPPAFGSFRTLDAGS